MSLFDTLQADWKAAFKAKESIKKDILWYVLAQAKNKKIDLQRDLTDDEVMKLIQKEIKMREESISYLPADSEDLWIEKEKIAILQTYLPEMLSEDALKNIIAEKVHQLGITDVQKQKWQLIGAIMKEYGPQVDGKLVQQLIHSHS